MTTDTDKIAQFLACDRFAVVGATDDRSKYGSMVFECYLQNGREVYPVNPRRKTVHGHTAFARLTDLPVPVPAISVITPPEVTEQVVEDAIAAGVEHIWMQPGAESDAAIERAEAAGLSVIAHGPCALVVMHYRG